MPMEYEPLNAIWAMVPERWPSVQSRILSRRGIRVELDDLPPEPSITLAAAPRLPAVKGMVALLPIRGTIVQHREDAWFGDVAADSISRLVDEAMGNPQVGGLVLDVDSPGGIVFGVEELADKIRGLRGTKPIYSIANSMAASAAFWIASAADKFFVTPGGMVGSIGVWQAHMDVSGYEEKLGVKTTLVSAGKYKVEGHPWAPLDDEARAAMQTEVDQYYAKFVDGVAKNRGIRSAAVRGGFGEGRMVLAEPAKAEGMVDGVTTLEELLGRVLGKRQNGQDSKAASRIAALEIAKAEEML
jgi:capsid assembly protease